MNKLRLLVDARSIGGEGQGIVTYIAGVYSEMLDNFSDRYEVFFAGYNFAELKKCFPQISKKQFIPVASKSRSVLFFYEFPKIIRQYKIDFAHFQYVVPFIKNCKFITTCHDVLFNDFPEDFSESYRRRRNLLFKRSLKKSELKLTVSNYSRAAIARHYNLDSEDIFVTPNAVKPVYFEEYNKKNASEYIKKKYNIENFLLYVSRVEPRKNHLMLLQAYQEMKLANQDLQLVFIGGDTLNSVEITNQFEALKKERPNHFHWIKYVEGDDLLEFYRAARMFVYPSKAEGFGIPPIEAAAMRINTLSSNVTAMGDFDFLFDNHFSPYEPEDLKKLITQNLLAPPSDLELIKISDIIKRRYSWRNAANLLHQLIQQEANQSVVAAVPAF